jgi:hypothetical protein
MPGGLVGSEGADRPQRNRTKKLIVAFHFLISNQDGWKCDACRKSGLEQKRRCGWLGKAEASQGPPVWARKSVALRACPKSFVTAESASMVEDYLVRKRLGGMDLSQLSARQADAFFALEEAVTEEVRDAQQQSRNAF